MESIQSLNFVKNIANHAIYVNSLTNLNSKIPIQSVKQKNKLNFNKFNKKNLHTTSSTLQNYKSIENIHYKETTLLNLNNSVQSHSLFIQPISISHHTHFNYNSHCSLLQQFRLLSSTNDSSQNNLPNNQIKINSNTSDEKKTIPKQEQQPINPQSSSLPNSQPIENSATPNLKIKPEKFLIGFTCKKCNSRVYKFITKKSYYEGVVIIRCDTCKNLHLIADHLGWYDSINIFGTIEDYFKRQEEAKKMGGNEANTSTTTIKKSLRQLSQSEQDNVIEFLKEEQKEENSKK